MSSSAVSPIRSRSKPTCSAPSKHLAQDLDRLLERRGEGARLLALALFRTDGKVHRIEVGTGAPLRESRAHAPLFADRLAVLGDACDPGFGFDVIRLAALVTERCDPVADRACRARSGRRTRASDRSTGRAFRPAARHPAGSAGHAYSGVRGGGGAGAEDRRRRMREQSKTKPIRRSVHRVSEVSIPAPIRPIRLFDQPERIEAGGSAGRPAGALSLAACAARSRARRRPRTHRHGMVAR